MEYSEFINEIHRQQKISALKDAIEYIELCKIKNHDSPYSTEYDDAFNDGIDKSIQCIQEEIDLLS